MKNKFWLFAVLFAAAGMTALTSCGDDPTPVPPPVIPPDPPTNVEAVNQWADGYMKTHYLWNTEYKALGLSDFDMDYKKFLRLGLDGVAAMDDANHEDGHWVNGKREYYYSYISAHVGTTASLGGTRAPNQTFGYGFVGLIPGKINGNIYLGVTGVTPESPAAEANIDRAIFISKVNNTSLTEQNYGELMAALFPSSGGTVKLSINTALLNDEGTSIVVKNVGTVTLTARNYYKNPIVFAQLVTLKDRPDVKIGYIAYNEFDAAFDNVLVGTFEAMKAQGPATDLILDLRYNGGGYLLSSDLLATLVVGREYKNRLYCEATYNADRNKTTQPNKYYIGNKNTGEGVYEMLETALDAATDLKRVYVLTGEGTASASELIINGLRGLDIEVRQIGETTNGKNVGMEGLAKPYKGYTYEFFPITMRLKNEKGFGEYSDGLVPDIEVKKFDNDYLLGAYCSSRDPLFLYALMWITEGEKPTVDKSTRSAQPFAIDDPKFIEPTYHGAITTPKLVE